jgi:hypothetical protein
VYINLLLQIFEGELPLYFVNSRCSCRHSGARCLVHGDCHAPLVSAPLDGQCFSLTLHNFEPIGHYVLCHIGCFELPTSQEKKVGKFKGYNSFSKELT